MGHRKVADPFVEVEYLGQALEMAMQEYRRFIAEPAIPWHDNNVFIERPFEEYRQFMAELFMVSDSPRIERIYFMHEMPYTSRGIAKIKGFRRRIEHYKNDRIFQPYIHVPVISNHSKNEKRQRQKVARILFSVNHHYATQSVVYSRNIDRKQCIARKRRQTNQQARQLYGPLLSVIKKK